MLFVLKHLNLCGFDKYNMPTPFITSINIIYAVFRTVKLLSRTNVEMDIKSTFMANVQEKI